MVRRGISVLTSVSVRTWYAMPKHFRPRLIFNETITSLRANGSRERAPDDRLREAIQETSTGLRRCGVYHRAGRRPAPLAPRNDEHCERTRALLPVTNALVCPSGHLRQENREQPPPRAGSTNPIHTRYAPQYIPPAHPH